MADKPKAMSPDKSERYVVSTRSAMTFGVWDRIASDWHSADRYDSRSAAQIVCDHLNRVDAKSEKP